MNKLARSVPAEKVASRLGSNRMMRRLRLRGHLIRIRSRPSRSWKLNHSRKSMNPVVMSRKLMLDIRKKCQTRILKVKMIGERI